MKKVSVTTLIITVLYSLCAAQPAFSESASQDYSIKADVIAAAGANRANIISSLAEPVVGNFQSAGISAAAGFIPLSEKQILSVSISKASWQIAEIRTDESTITSPQEAIIIINDGNTKHALELSITDTAGWSASNTPGQEMFSLKGLLCSVSDVPADDNFAAEDTIATYPKKASGTVFSYAGSTQNASVVRVKDKRALFLKFESPTKTQRTETQQIEATITVQLP